MWQESISEMMLPSRTAPCLPGVLGLCIFGGLILGEISHSGESDLTIQPLCFVCGVQHNLKLLIYFCLKTPFCHKNTLKARFYALYISASLAPRTKPDIFWFKKLLYRFLWAEQYSGYNYGSYTVSSCSCKT